MTDQTPKPPSAAFFESSMNCLVVWLRRTMGLRWLTGEGLEGPTVGGLDGPAWLPPEPGGEDDAAGERGLLFCCHHSRCFGMSAGTGAPAVCSQAPDP